MKYLFPFIYLFLCLEVFGQPVYLKPQIATCFTDKEINLESEKLAPNFQGNDAAKVIETITRRQEVVIKDEFETTKQFQDRVAIEKAKPILGNLSYSSNYIFEIGSEFKYNADTEIMTSFFERSNLKLINRDCRSSYNLIIPKNSGIKFPEAFVSNDYKNFPIIEFPVKLESARSLKPALRLFVIAQLTTKDTNSVKIDYGAKYLFLEPKHLWVVDSSTGNILKKVIIQKPIKVNFTDKIAQAKAYIKVEESMMRWLF
jgi:hypothetical protein